ncbi:MAG: ABC transporter ATP-binding protein [Candidatus Eisenbacteria bacterium]
MKALFRQLGPAFLPYRRAVAWGIGCVVLTNLISLAQPQVLRFAVDDLYRGVTAEKLGRYALLLLAIATAAGLFKFAMRIALLGVSRRIEFDLRARVFDRLLLQPSSYYQRAGIGDLVARATSDLAAVRMMLGPGIMYLVNTVVVTLASLAFLLSISPWLTLVSLLPLPFTSLAMWFFGERIHRGSERIQEQFAKVSARAQESFAGVRVVRSLGRESREIAEFHALHEEYRVRQASLTRVAALFQPSLAFLAGLAALLAIAYGGRAVVRDQITLGEFVAFTVYLGMLNWPMVALGWIIHLFQRGAASYARLREVLEAEPEMRSPDSPRTAPARGAIEVRNLDFTYPGGSTPVLRGVSLDIPAGSRVAIVGATGSGKSTLAGLLVRRFDPPSGTVLLDGVDIRDYELAELRTRFAVVAQEAFLFAGSIGENIVLGGDRDGERSTLLAAEAAGLGPDLAAIPAGLDEPVGERGSRLSGGQRQRVAIARALHRAARVLVLDDPLASVDAFTEAAILRGLARRAGQATTVIVTHRAAGVEGADQVVVLEDGRVAEAGPPGVLRARNGAFARWLREQELEAELEAS